MTMVSYRDNAAIFSRALYVTTAFLTFCCATLSAPALAEQPAPAAEKKPAVADDKSKSGELEEVVVTGTLIRGIAPPGSNLIETTRQDIELSGTTDANQMLNQLPQSNTFMTLPQPGLGVAAGVGRVPLNQPNLRNLPGGSTGNPVTLVMMDGHRIVPSGIEQSLVDVGIVPQGIVERVETILDGASAQYGSDAVGGVINYMTRKRVNDSRVNLTYGYADNYWATNVDLTTGKTWDTGGIAFSYSFGKNSNLLNGDRDYAVAHNYLLPGAPLTGTACEDHSTISIPPPPALATQQFSTQNVAPGIVPGVVNCPSNAFTSFVASQERHAGFVDFSQDLSATIKLDVTGLYTKRTSDQNFGPPTTTVTIQQGVNPYFQSIPNVPAASQARQSVAFSYGPVLGTDYQDYKTGTTIWQVTPAVTVDMGQWQLRALVAYGKSEVTFDQPTLDTTLQGAAVSGTTLNTAINPYNIKASQNLALVKSFFYNTHRDGNHEFTQARAIADGPIFSMPGGEVRAAFGLEWIKTDFERVDTVAATHLLTPAVKASSTAKAVFAELNLPFVGASNRMTGIEDLTLSASGRYDDYGDYGTTFNPKFALTYSPTKWLSFNGSWGTSFRAPTVVDKAASSANAMACVGNVPGCIQGFFQLPPEIPVAPAGNQVFLYLTGANTALKPETSTNYSFGFDLRPIQNLVITPTYYHIDYKDVISLPTVGVTLAPTFAGAKQLYKVNPTAAEIDAFALNAANGPQVVAAQRAAGNNILYYLDGRTTNLGASTVSGLDLGVRYNHPTSFGSLDGSLNGTWRLQADTQLFAGGTVVDSIAADTPVFRMTAQLGGNYGHFRAQLTWLHMAGFDLTATASRLPSQTTMSAFDLLDLSLRYSVESNTPLLQDLMFTLTVNNTLDKDPPIAYTNAGGSGNGQTLGRFVQFGLSKKF
jgi:iron complex outermembrane recepter protein